MENDTYKLQPLPASIQTQVYMLNSTIDDAKNKLAQAETDRYTVLDTFYDLKGKMIELREKQGSWRAGREGRIMTYRLRVEQASYNDIGSLRYIIGTVIPKGKQPADVRYGVTKYVYASAIIAGNVTVLGDA